ncbi:hypothetical protein ACHAW6_013286 [Cyclotella cf. meneghiniana]
MINLPFSETKENDSSSHQPGGKQQPLGINSLNILGTSLRHPHINTQHNNTSSNIHRRTHRKELSMSPSSLEQNLAKQGWQNHDNWVYSQDNCTHFNAQSGNAPSSEVFDRLHYGKNSPNQRRGYSHSVAIDDLTASIHSFANVQRRHTSIPTICQSSPHDPKSTSGFHKIPGVAQRPRVSYIQKRYMFLSCAILLAVLGIFIDVNRIMDYASSATVTTSADWIKNLHHSLGVFHNSRPPDNVSPVEEVFKRAYGAGSAHASVNVLLGPNAISIEDEWAHVREMSSERARQRRMRTSPSIQADAERVGVGAVGHSENMAPPSLVLDLPSHRSLDSELVDGATKDPNKTNKLRRLEPTASAVCGPHAKEASQLNPSHYPESAALNAASRVVITGALSQLGMEIILFLHEKCGVSYIMGIDSAYPNTRHERIEMMEWRYKYLARRVPQFQRLMIPVFGIHPHPKVGEEVRYEAEGNSFTIMRFEPTHIVHLAGMEEGMDEHVDYGDTTDVSPFASGSSDMMRRFESLVSMDQVLMALKQTNNPKPQLVYISSNEASERSGVEMVQRRGGRSSPANVYGSISLMKEILASYYYRHHGVESVGLRIPTLLGPFSRHGSVVHDLAERTVRNAAGKNVKGVPKYHTDRDRYDLSTIWKKREGAEQGRVEQVAFASDVAQAVVAAMQFREDTADRANGPTIMRLGSKITTSMKDMRERMEGYLPPYNQWESSGENSLIGTDQFSNAVTISGRDFSIHDADRNRDLLGWVHSTRMHEGTKSMLAWHVLKAFPFGLPMTVPSHNAFKQIVADSFSIHDRHSLVPLPCASGCRWPGFCTSSVWDEIMEITKTLTESCPYVLYTVDLRPELVNMEKQSAPSQRSGWEARFCKIAFVSSSSKLAKAMYGNAMHDRTPMHVWNGKRKDGYWFVIVVNGSQYTMNEAERSMLKLAPNHIFHDRVEKAMYINHRRVCLTTDQATGVMRHLDMKGRDRTDKKTIVTEDKTEMRVYLPPRAPRHSVFFTNRYSFPGGFDTSNAKNLAKFVMSNMGIAETSDIRSQLQFYEQSSHYTRTNTGRSANYQEFFQENFFPYDFLRTTWLVHELKSEEGRNLRCEMYQEHSLWGNNGMEDLSIGYVLASRKVRMQLGKMAAPEYEGPEEWYPLLVPKEPTDEDVIDDGPVYLDYLEASQKVTKDDTGTELYISFLPQKRE